MTIAVAVGCLAWLGAASASAQASPAAPVVADLSLTGQSQSIPRSFFGLSIEYKELKKFENEGPLFDRMISVMRSQNGSPMLLRLGGRSADELYWNTPVPTGMRWISDLQPAWLDQLAALVRRDSLRVELDVNVAVHSPAMAAAFARAAQRALPAGGLAGLAIGNEPDLYRLQPRLELERIASTTPSTPRHWTKDYSPTSYLSDYRSYARALLRAVPGTPLTAPDNTFPNITWPSAIIGLGRLSPRAISFHRYAGAYCKRIHFHKAPTLSSFLGNGYSTGLARTLRNDIALVQAHSLVLRVTEMNSVTCGGQKGVADSFATALWAPDALFEMLRAGVNGINWHIRPDLPNSPFQLGSGAIVPLPEIYGLAMFARMIGPDARLEQVSIVKPSGLRLKVWAVRSASGLKLLLINKSSHAATAHLHIAGASRPALLSRLLAPKLGSLRGVTLAGQSIGPDARWHGPRITSSIAPTNGTYRLRVPGYSAASVDLGNG